MRQSYLDRVSNPGRGEQSVESHNRIALSHQHPGELHIRNHLHRALRQRAQRIPRVSLGRGTSHTAHSHLTPTHLFQQEAQKTETAIFRNVWVLLAFPGIWLTSPCSASSEHMPHFRPSRGTRPGHQPHVPCRRRRLGCGEVERKARVVQKLAWRLNLCATGISMVTAALLEMVLGANTW